MRARKYTYIPNAEIESITTWNGKEIPGSKLLDGAYARGKVQYGEGGEIDVESIKQGDKIESISGEQYYVADPYFSDKYFWVTKDYKQRFDDRAEGYTLLKSDVVEIVERPDEYDDYAKGGKMMAKGGLTTNDKETIKEYEDHVKDNYAKDKKYWQSKEDEEMVKLADDDLSDHLEVISSMKTRHWKNAYNTWRGMDTASREEITNDAYDLLMSKSEMMADGGMMAKGGVVVKAGFLKGLPIDIYNALSKTDNIKNIEKFEFVDFEFDGKKFETKIEKYKLTTEWSAEEIGEDIKKIIGKKYNIDYIGYYELEITPKMADGGMMAKGGNVDEIVDAIYYSNNILLWINTSFGSKTKEGLRAMIENDSYTSKEIAESIFSVNKKNGRIDTTYGSKSILGLTEMINSARGNTFVKVKMANGGMMAKGGYTSRHRKRTLEEKAIEMYGSDWFDLDERTRKELIDDLRITKGAKGLMVGNKYVATFTLDNGKAITKTYNTKDELDEGIGEMYSDYDVIDVKIEETKAKEEAKVEDEKKGTFKLAKVTEKTTSKGKVKRQGVVIEGIESDISRYDELKAIMKNAKAESDLIGGRIKEVGFQKWIELYEQNRTNPNSIDLIDGDENIMLQVKDSYKKVEPEKRAILQENYPDLLETTIVYTIDTALLDKYGEVLTNLINNSKDIEEKDKENLIKGESTTIIKSGSVDKLLNYPNPEEVFTLIEPVMALY